MCDIAHVFVFIVFVKIIGHCDTSMLAACAADTDRQVPLLFVIVSLEHEIEIGKRLLYIALRQFGIKHIITDRFIITGLVFQLFHIERIIQHPDIKDHIRVIRQTILETEGFKSNGKIIKVIVFLFNSTRTCTNFIVFYCSNYYTFFISPYST